MATALSDPVVLLTLTQTVVLTLTMVVFILQFRSQNQATKDAAYEKAMDDYTNAISLLVERPELGGALDIIGSALAPGAPKAATSTSEDRALFGYMLLNYSLLERIHSLYEKKWIDKGNWDQWHAFMRAMARHPMFQEVHRRSQGTFDQAFQNLVDEAIAAS